jgi:hypothetical protein
MDLKGDLVEEPLWVQVLLVEQLLLLAGIAFILSLQLETVLLFLMVLALLNI